MTLLSFGYKHGMPLDADLAFDMRCLPNPHFVAALRRRTGRDRAVASFMERDRGEIPFEETGLFSRSRQISWRSSQSMKTTSRSRADSKNAWRPSELNASFLSVFGADAGSIAGIGAGIEGPK